jgi:hypothetical protein
VAVTRAKCLVNSIICIGGTLSVAAVISSKDLIIEQWWLYRLRSDNPDEVQIAATRLGEIGSVRAVPVLVQCYIEWSRSFVQSPDDFLDGIELTDERISFESRISASWSLFVRDDHQNGSRLGRVVKTALVRIGAPTVRVLVDALHELVDTAPRLAIVSLLGELGAIASNAVPELERIYANADPGSFLKHRTEQSLMAVRGMASSVTK